jgi:para-nitrobenzyl esterase
MKSTVAALFGAALLLAGAAQPAFAADPPLTVAIKSCDATTPSSVTGSTFGGPMRQFLGIPYAAPPTGKNRWMPPQPFKCWGGEPRVTQTFGNTCPQNGFGSEDCLFLNVFTPATGTVKGLPVMVWIHGGALVAGGGNINPAPLVERGVVVVSINYRLGALGFLAHPALDDVKSKRTGNYGIQDQQAALQWVKSNIAAFGGNPSSVTIFGQSAGGLSVMVHLVSPLSTGLFQKAISESAAIGGTPQLLNAAEASGQQFATQPNINCPGTGKATATCLRGIGFATIQANQGIIGQSTALLRVDDVVLKKTLVDSMSAGEFKKVPIINGSTHDEMRFYLYGNANVGTLNSCTFTSGITKDNLASKMQSNGFPNSSVTAYSFGVSDSMTANAAFTAAGTDRNFACPIYRASARIADHGGKIFAYEFNDPNSPQTQLGTIKLADGTVFPYRAYHGAEVQYHFKAPGSSMCGPYPDLSSSEKKLSAAMVTYWTTFAKTGDPNPTDADSPPPAWPAFKTTGKMMSLVASKPKAFAASAFDNDHKCTSFWNGFGG